MPAAYVCAVAEAWAFALKTKQWARSILREFGCALGLG
jgi:hypothetical protein